MAKRNVELLHFKRRTQITIEMLDSLAEHINRIAGTPCKPYIENKPQAKCYLIQVNNRRYPDWGGGYTLNQMCDEGTGERHILGAKTKRDLHNQMHAFIYGLCANKKTPS